MKTSLNLMTDEDRRLLMLQESKQFWAKILLSTIVVLASIGTAEWWHSRATSVQLRMLESRFAPMQELKNECLGMRTEINAMRKAQQLTLRLVDNHPTVTLLGAVSAAAQSAEKVFVAELELQHGDLGNQQHKAVVVGVGKDNAAIAKFSAALRGSELFRDVTLSASDNSQVNNESVRSFRIECQL